ncbi:hypothetical protein HYS31_07810 [Candidatus Woesearchaeota archaeon]|nr:hypothetical protein [Candidatus Woesearchaeota archaeon]
MKKRVNRLIYFPVVVFIFLLVLLSIVSAQELNLQFDAVGNLVTGDGYYRIYDGFNHLSQIRAGNNASAPLLYSFMWHPIEERILIKDEYYPNGTEKSNIFYVSDEYVHIQNASGNYSEIYVYAEGQLVAYVNTDGQKRFVHADLLGSSVLITDEQGNVVEETFYAPYGEIISGGQDSRYDYTGKEFDPITQEYDFGPRRYKPDWTMFTQPDPILPDPYDPQQLNRYSYARNNPYRYVDPSGHYIESAVDVGFIIYDIQELKEEHSLVNYLALGADTAGLIIPFVTGGGLAVRGAGLGAKTISRADRGSDLVATSQRIADRLGPTTSTIGGTVRHREAASALKQSGLRDVYTEVSLKDSVIAPYGTRGSTRVDAIKSSQDLSRIGTKVDPTQTKSAVDFKFGQSGLSKEQTARIQKQTGVKPVEIKPKPSLLQRIKSFFSRSKK